MGGPLLGGRTQGLEEHRDTQGMPNALREGTAHYKASHTLN